MQILTEMWEYRNGIGFVVLLLLVYFGWQELKKAVVSARKSNQKFLAKAEVLPTEDVPELGAEARVRSDLFKK